MDDLEALTKIMKNNFGINVTISNMLYLRSYLTLFEQPNEMKISPQRAKEVWNLFLLNRFGIDSNEVGMYRPRMTYHKYALTEKQEISYFGLGLAGTENFKTYCKNHADEWKEEAYSPEHFLEPDKVNTMKTCTYGPRLSDRLRQADDIKKICMDADLMLTPFGTTFEGTRISVHYSYHFQRRLGHGKRSFAEYGPGIMIVCEWTNPEFNDLVKDLARYANSTKRQRKPQR